jgi:hypothetical protein
MKKALKILGGLVVLILILMFIIPYFYKDKVIDLVKKEANKNLNATLDFGEVDLTFFAHFPSLTLRIEDLSLTGQGAFEGIELVSFKSFDLVLGLGKVLAGEEMPDINKIFLNQPKVNALVLENGMANWDIVKAPKGGKGKVSADSKPSEAIDFKIQLRSYEIRDAEITYIDRLSDILIMIKGFSHSGSGSLSTDGFGLRTKTKIESMDLIMDNTKYINHSTLNAAVDFAVDMNTMRFDITKGDINLNKFEMNATGFLAMPGDDINMDIEFTSPSTKLKQLMALAPEEITGDLDEYKFKGNVAFSGWVKGVYNDNQYPLFGIHLAVDNGSFHYADLPKSAENINIKTDIELMSSKDLNSLVIDVSQFDIDLGGNPIKSSLALVNPMTSMDVKSIIEANINLASLKDVLPIEKEEELTGMIDANLSFEGSLEAAGNEQYDKLEARGHLKLQDFTYNSPDFSQPVLIDKTTLLFNLNKAELESFDASIGKSDFSATGQLIDFLPYLLMDKELKGSLNYHSDFLDIDELIAFANTESEVVTSTAVIEKEEKIAEENNQDSQGQAVTEQPSTAKNESVTNQKPEANKKPVEHKSPTAKYSSTEELVQQEEKLIPENINFVLRATVSEMLYDNINMKNFRGLMWLKGGKLTLENCKLNTLGGSAIVNGEFYEIEKGKSNATFDFKLNNLNIKKAAGKVEMVEKYAPMALYTKGSFSTEFTFKSELDQELNPVYKTVYSKGRLRTHGVKIEGYKPLDTFAEITKTGDILHQQLEDVNINYEIIDGKAFIKPFDFKIDKISGNSFGSIDLDQNLDFLVHLKIPTEMLGEDANNLMGQVAGSLAGFGIKVDVPEFIEMDIEITGKADNPKFKPSITGLSGDDVKEQVKEKLKEEFDNAKEEAKKRAKEEADKIIADAQKEADNLMREAKKQGEALKKEVYKQADDLVENASGFLEKTGAELASKELKKQADQQVDSLLKEAQKQADKIIEDARKEAAKIK